MKGKFEPRPLDSAHGNALLTGVDLHGLSLSIVDEPARVERLRASPSPARRLEMNTPRTHKESIDVARIGSAEIAAHRDGISIKGPMIWVLRQLGEMTPHKAMTPGTWPGTAAATMSLAGYASAPAFGWIASRDNDRPTQVAAGRAWSCACSSRRRRSVSRCSRTARPCRSIPEMAALRAAMRGKPAWQR